MNSRQTMSNWLPVSAAPAGCSLLCRSGANLYFAGQLDGRWYRDDMREMWPREFLREDKTTKPLYENNSGP